MNALVELNEHLTEAECAEAVATLEQVFVGDSLLQTNEAKYKMLRDGIPVKKVQPDGSMRTELARAFDFEHPKLNRFVAAEELWVKGPMHRRRCDLVGFVNGVPLLFVEFKRHDKDVLRAYEDNYTDYQDTIPQIFYYNAFVMLSNGLESKIGTLGSSYEFFGEWKRLSEGDVGSVALETMMRGVCNKETLLDLFQNFILFDHRARARATRWFSWPRRFAERSRARRPSWCSRTATSSTNRLARRSRVAGALRVSPPSAAAPRAARTWWRSSIQAISFR